MDRTLIATPAPGWPRIRDELRLLPAHANRDGSPAWLIQDPVANRFFRIGWLDFEMLARWAEGGAEAIAGAVSRDTTLTAEPDDVSGLLRFLRDNHLLVAQSRSEVDAIREAAKSRQAGLTDWLLHHYLFFRVPLVRPQDALATLVLRLGWLFTRGALAAILATSAVALVIVIHQWDTFANSAVDHLSWPGLLGFALAIVLAKLIHELGHALTAAHHGVRVAHMGVAFVVLLPMLYTDTSESWKLTDSRKRLAIAGAGIAAELALAAVASLLWSLAPDGAFRTAMFFLATTSWVLTLAVNASPFMRFDGYFILCDLIDFPNLHERAGRFARVGLRRWIAGFADPWPEGLTAARRQALIAFALATWLYRVLVFLGIALLVYAYCFKLLGIALMLLEVGWFIGRPVQAELKVWWSRRAEVRAGRRRLGLALIGLSLALLLVPWQSGVHGDGYLRSARQQQVFAPRAGQIVAMPARREVQQGELIFALNAPDLRTGADRARAMAEARATELIGLGGQKDGEERRAILQSERDRLLAEASVFTGEQSRLKLTAAFPGVLTDVDELLKAGVWVGPDLPLATLFDPTSWVADIYVAESQVERVRAGDEARIYCGPEAFTGRVVQVDSSRATTLAHPMLAVTSGGPIATIPRATRDGREPLVRDGLYRVRIELAEVPQRPRMALCAAVIDAKRRAMLHGVFDQALSVLIRESGF